MAAATGMAIMKTHREMMRRTVCSVYELFENGQIENLCQLIDKDARLDCSAFCDYNPMRGMYFGRSDIREWLIERKSAVELKSYKWQICEVDEARGTVLVQLMVQGKFRITEKSFNFNGFDLMHFRNGRIHRMKFWGDDREMAKASKTPATELAFKIAHAFFNQDQATMQKLIGNGKMAFHGANVNPSVGQWTVQQWMEHVKKHEFQYTSRRMVFQSKNHVILEYRASHFRIAETGQSLLGHRPEHFRFYAHLMCDDQMRVREYQMHMSPSPSGFLFAKPLGGANKPGLIQHVQHAHEMRAQMQGQRAH